MESTKHIKIDTDMVDIDIQGAEYPLSRQYGHGLLDGGTVEFLTGVARRVHIGTHLFNHDDGGATGVAHEFDDARQVLVARATRDLAAGEEAFTAYGTHRCNGSLLVGGGFAVGETHQLDAQEFGLFPRLFQ